MKHPLPFAALALLPLLAGCVRWREVTVEVRTPDTQEPVPGAYVHVMHPGMFLAGFGAGRYPIQQGGVTDEHGRWPVMLPIGRHGMISARHPAVGSAQFWYEPAALSDRRLIIELHDQSHQDLQGQAPLLEEPQ